MKREYSDKLKAHKGGAPRGGDVPMPSIPRFDSDPRQAQQKMPGAPGLLDSDTLPEPAHRDPRFVQGIGSELAVNQPHLAMQYGVVRRGRFVPPQQLLPEEPDVGRPILRPETVQGLEHLRELENKKNRAEDASIEDAVREGNSTERLAGAVDPPTESEKADAKKVIDGMDDLDYYNFTQAMMRDLINNESQRKIIESRLDDIDITDLIMHGTFSQKVPIVEEKFEPTFETISGENDLALKRLIADEARQLEVNERYLLDKFAMMQLAAGVKAIGSIQMPEYRDGSGKLVPDMFWKRFNKLSSLPTPILASLGANFFWFDVRCRQACTAKELKNG